MKVAQIFACLLNRVPHPYCLDAYFLLLDMNHNSGVEMIMPQPRMEGFHSALEVPTQARLSGLKDPLSKTGGDGGAPSPADSPPVSILSCRGEYLPRSKNLFAPRTDIVHTPLPILSSQPALLVGLSGSSSSGKTTLAHFLSLILPPASPVFILHQDDFFVSKTLLVPSATGDFDADCTDAIDFAAFMRVLRYVKREGRLPSRFRTLQAEEYEREMAVSLIGEDVIEELKGSVAESGLFECGRAVGIVDGFLMYHDPTIRELLDIKLFLRSSKEQSSQRRFGRPDYTESELGSDFFWRTREYFDKTVWPNYRKEHGPLFENEDVEGKPRMEVCKALGISVQERLDDDVKSSLRWAVRSILMDIKDMKIKKPRDWIPEKIRRKYEDCECQSSWLGRVRQALFDVL